MTACFKSGLFSGQYIQVKYSKIEYSEGQYGQVKNRVKKELWSKIMRHA